MVKPSSWVTVRTVWDTLASSVFDAHGYDSASRVDQIDFEGLSVSTAEACWAFIGQVREFWLMLPSGNVVMADHRLRACADTSHPKGEHFDLKVGVIGSGTGEAARQAGMDLPTFYGPFHLGMVQFSSAEFSAFLDRLGRENFRADMVSLPQQIIIIWRSKPNMTKDAVRTELGYRPRSRPFDKAWRMACQDEPKMAAKGRRPLEKPTQ